MNKFPYTKKAVSLIGFLFALKFASAQIIDSKICEENKYPIITRYVKVLKCSSSISLDSILSSDLSSKFSELEDKPFIFLGYDPYYYWFKFIINNTDSSNRDLILSLGPTGMRNAELFQEHLGQFKSLGKTGNQYSFDERPYPYMHYAFPLTVSASSLDTFYLKINAEHDFKRFGFALIAPATLKTFEDRVYFFFGIIVGVLLLFLFINLYVYFSFKEKVHLWYAFYIGVLILIVLKNDQLDQEFLGFDSFTAYRMLPFLGLGAFGISILMHVVQLYLGNIHSKSGLYKVTLLVKWNLILSAISQFAVFYFTSSTNIEKLIFNWADYSAVLGITAIIINCIYSIKKGLKSALFILAGLCGFLMGAIQKLLLIPTDSLMFPPSIFHIGILLETTIISFGFIYVYGAKREEKKQLELNFKQELHKTQLEIQEQTFKNISQEIHDNIGMGLSVIKLTINSMNVNDPAVLQGKITECNHLMAKAIQDLRDLSKSLNTDFVIDLGLYKSIEYQLKIIRNTSAITTNLSSEGAMHSIPPQKELILFRIFQEVLNNIIKHSKASAITVQVHYGLENFILKITDDGRGFNTSNIDNNNYAGIGIKNIKNRANIIGADLTINSEIGKGTSIKILLPK